MIDTNGFNIIQEEANKSKQFIMMGEWMNAFDARQRTATAVYDQTIQVDFYNVLEKRRTPRPDSLLAQGMK